MRRSRRCSASAAAHAPLVGARIAVFWPLDDVFYPATVLCALPANRHLLLYDDLHKETLNLSAERFHILTPAPSPTPSPTPPPPPPLEPYVLPSLTHVPIALPPRKRYSRRSCLAPKRPSLKLSTPRKKASLTIRVRPPPPPSKAALRPLSAPNTHKLASTRDLLSPVSDVPTSPHEKALH